MVVDRFYNEWKNFLKELKESGFREMEGFSKNPNPTEDEFFDKLWELFMKKGN